MNCLNVSTIKASLHLLCIRFFPEQLDNRLHMGRVNDVNDETTREQTSAAHENIILIVLNRRCFVLLLSLCPDSFKYDGNGLLLLYITGNGRLFIA